MDFKNVALIGTGRMSKSHIIAMRKLGLDLVAICDIRPEALESVGEEFNVPEKHRYLNPDDLLSELDNIDLVVIATTADTHSLLTIGAANAGVRAILCEKPMATSIEQCDAMLNACNKSGTRLAINHQMRFMPQYNLVKTALNEGKLGRLASMNVVAGCFGLAMNGSHYIEAFHYLTNSWPQEVSASFTGDQVPNPRGPDFYDQAGEFHFFSETGQRLNLSIGHDQGHGMTVTYACAYGHIFVDELEGEMIITNRLTEHQSMPMTRYGMPWERLSKRFVQADNIEPTRAVMSSLVKGENYPDGYAGRNIVAAVAACYTSAESDGRIVSIKDNKSTADRVFNWA